MNIGKTNEAGETFYRNGRSSCFVGVSGEVKRSELYKKEVTYL